MKETRGFVACVLWTAAASLMVGGTLDSLRDGVDDYKVLAWGLFVSVIAHQVTAWCAIRRHHHQQKDESSVDVEQIVEIVDSLHRRSDVAQIR